MGSIKVGVFGHYGNNNLGDEAIIRSVIQNLRLRIPDIDIKGFSVKPQDTQRRFNIDSYPIRNIKKRSNKSHSNNERKQVNLYKNTDNVSIKRSFTNVLKRNLKKGSAIGGLIYLIGNLRSEIKFLQEAKEGLKDLDALLFCGSNQFLDNFGGPWGFPYTLMKWVLLAKLTDTKVIFLSIGAGPLKHRLSYWMLKKTLHHADYLSYRDEGSKRLIEENISGLNGFVYPDLAHGLKSIPESRDYYTDKKVVAINPMPVFDRRYWYKSKPDKYEAYVGHLANLVRYLTSQGFIVKLYNNHPKDILVIEDIKVQFKKINSGNLNNFKIIHNKTVQDLINIISEADIIVGTRFHSTVLPIRLNKPVLGICYHRKSKELLHDVGLGSYCVNIDEIQEGELNDKFNSILENTVSIKEKMAFNFKKYEALIDDQWDKIVGIIKN